MVSWTERGGKYYIAEVDRSLVKAFIESGSGSGMEVLASPRKNKKAGAAAAAIGKKGSVGPEGEAGSQE